MTAFSDLSPEEHAAYHERIRQTLARADETLADTAAWQAERRASGADFDERYGERQRQEMQPAATPQPPPASPVTRAPARDAERKWVEGIAGKKIRTLIDKGLIPFAKEIAKDLTAADKRIAALEKRVEADGVATVDLLLQLERRLAELEGRVVLKPPPKPKLVNSDDAA